MKKSISIIIALLTSILFFSCGEDDPIIEDILGNKYKIVVNGNVYDEGQNIFAGITTFLDDEDGMQAGLTTTLAIVFDKSNYTSNKVLNVNINPNVSTDAAATGVLVLNKDQEDEEICMYVAVAGTVHILSKNKIEFDLTCYALEDIGYDDELNYSGPVDGAKVYHITGYIEENNPVE